MTSAERSGARRDGGFTLPELTIVIVLSGILVAALATALSVAFRVTPTSESRIDDARSTRSLSTWLSHDTTSTPPHWPEEAAGGFNIDPSDDGTNNLCGGSGANIVHMRWTETITSPVTYVANYRFISDPDGSHVRRYTCYAADSDPFTTSADRVMTPDLSPSQVPTASITTDAGGNVTVVSFTLAGSSGETVLLETSSRNPSDFFP